MTDESYVFNQDVRERSKMKTGAMHKKNGSKSRKCTLPSDHLTASQKKKLNGPVTSIAMNKPYFDWNAFRALPETMQSEYLSGLIQNYGARGSDIADMFGVHSGAIYCLCSNYNPKVKFTRKPGEKGMDDRWRKFSESAEYTEAKAKFRHAEVTRLFGPQKAGEPNLEPVKINELKPDDISQTERIAQAAKSKALYLKTFYDECVALGFGEAMSQTLTIEQSKIRKGS